MLKPVETKSQTCPICHTAIICRMEMCAISSKLLDRAVQIRKGGDSTTKSKDKSKTNNIEGNSNGKNDKISAAASNLPEASYLILSGTYDPAEDVLPSSPLWEADFQRTGRWSKEEADYVDYICKAFDDGQLILPRNTKLKDFLCKMLLCKGSRLTKRYKNAKLSMKAYEMKLPNVENKLNCEELSNLQDKFLTSMNSEAAELEARFNINFTWNLMFSRFCNENGYDGIDFTKWNASLELMEQKASDVEVAIRTFRRKNVELTLGRFDMKGHENIIQSSTTRHPYSASTSASHNKGVLSKPMMPSRMVDQSNQPTPIQNGSEFNTGPSLHNRIAMNEFAGVFNDADEIISQKTFISQRYSSSGGCVSLLKTIISFMENYTLPFHSADVWVLSTGPPPETPQKSPVSALYNGGYGTRTDLDVVATNQLNQFGEYSSKFLFQPGGGLPGLAHRTGEPQWATNLDHASPDYFERATGTRVYGIKTALAVPIQSKSSTCVIVMYSLAHVMPDENITNMIVAELSRYTLRPKWKIIVDSDAVCSSDIMEQQSRSITVSVDHRSHYSGEDELVRHSVGGSHNGSLQQKQKQNGTSNRRDVASPVTLADEVIDGHEIDLQIATLLGENIPLITSNAAYPYSNNYSGNDNNRPNTMENFISLRLLILRPPDRRGGNENAVVDIIRQSYRSYRQMTRWNDQEIASLLVSDWMHLRPSLL